MHLFDRSGNVLAVQDKHNFYQKEKPWFTRGTTVSVCEAGGVKVGMCRGNDLLSPQYMGQLRGADVVFASTMATDDLMIDAARVRAMELQACMVIASFIGPYMGMDFKGNAAILEPVSSTSRSLRTFGQTRPMAHRRDEGLIEATIDLDRLRRARADRAIL